MISYSQNFEDVMLWRALKHIEKGFYVDVGANDPEVGSVTKYFYDNGWRGINIEPVAEWYDLLMRERVRDINLNLAAGAEDGEISFYEIAGTGLSTSVKDISLEHASRHGFVGVERKVPVRRLTDICTELHVAPIHFLKIDVEGAEKSVLLGVDLALIKPWIIVVESTLPLSQDESFVEWESIIFEADYSFVYFDGLNRFYLSPEHDELRQSFNCPPNVFDDFSFSGSAGNNFCSIQKEKIVGAEAEVRALAQRFEQAEAQAQAQAQRAENAEVEAQAQAQRAENAEAEALVQAHQAEVAAEETNAHAKWLQNEWDLAKSKIDELNRSSHHWWTVAQDLERERKKIYASRSWRITWPLRQLSIFVRQGSILPRNVVLNLKERFKNILRPVLLIVIRAVLKNSRLKKRINTRLHRYPVLRGRLLAIARRAGLVNSAGLMGVTDMQKYSSDLSTLSDNALSIYLRLDSLIQQNNRKVR